MRHFWCHGLQLQQAAGAPQWAWTNVAELGAPTKNQSPERPEDSCLVSRFWGFQVAPGAAGRERRPEEAAARSADCGYSLRLGWLRRFRSSWAAAGSSGLWHWPRPRRPQHRSAHGWAADEQRELCRNGGSSITGTHSDQSLGMDRYG